MAELKTKPTGADVRAFIDALDDEQRRADCLAIDAMMREATGEAGRLWGESIVGYGSYHYVYESGREGDWFIVGFSPRKANLTLYLMQGYDNLENEMKTLGKFKTGKACLYIKRLADIDSAVLRRLVDVSVQKLRG